MSILSRGSYEVLLEEIPNYAGNYLEIGVYDGDMIREFALKWPERTFYAIDPFISDKDTVGHTGVPVGERMETQQKNAHRNFKGISNIILFEQTSSLFVQAMNQETLDAMNVDVVYVDGNHSYEDTLNDLQLAARLIKHDGLIYIDDWDLPEVIMATGEFIEGNENRILEFDKHKVLLR